MQWITFIVEKMRNTLKIIHQTNISVFRAMSQGHKRKTCLICYKIILKRKL